VYILIIGGGSTGRALATHLIGEGQEIVIVEEDEERAKSLAEAMDALIIHGDGSDPEILKDAGVDRTEAAAVVTPDDNTNLTVCQILKKFNVPRIVARVNDPGKKDLYIGLQITAAISPTAAVVSYFKNALTQGSSKSMMSIANGLGEVIELKVSNEALNGKRIKDIGLPQGSIIAVIFRHGEVIIGTGNTVIKNNDVLTIISKTDVVKDVMEIFKPA
jgi:trk system potassium uptake protein TrkA